MPRFSEGQAIFALIVLFMLLFAGVFGLIYLDARHFAEECIAAGGYVAAPSTCVR